MNVVLEKISKGEWQQARRYGRATIRHRRKYIMRMNWKLCKWYLQEVEIMNMTDSQIEALEWLKNHNGTGVFDKNGILIAAGERAPFRRITWNRLRDNGYLTIEKKRVNYVGKI